MQLLPSKQFRRGHQSSAIFRMGSFIVISYCNVFFEHLEANGFLKREKLGKGKTGKFDNIFQWIKGSNIKLDPYSKQCQVALGTYSQIFYKIR